MRVLGLSRMFAGNVLTRILGGFGAEVFKVELPEGDALRAWKTNGRRDPLEDLRPQREEPLPRPARSARLRPAPQGACPCAEPSSRTSGRGAGGDGLYVGLSGSIQTLAERLSRAIGRPDLVDDPRLRINAARPRHAEEPDAIFGAFIGTRMQSETIAFFGATEVSIGPIYDAAHLVATPQVIARAPTADSPDPDMGPVSLHHVVPRPLTTPGSIRTPAPAPGQHTRKLLAGIGIADEAVQALACDGVVRGG